MNWNHAMQTFSLPIQLESSRLILRQWKATDFEDFANLNADPTVMAHFPATLSKLESLQLAEKFQTIIAENGWGFWAVELKKNHQFIGFVGLQNQPTRFSFSPCVEIGWRLAQQFWHQGYATEAAQVCLKFAFEQLALEEVVSFTAMSNVPSQQVMQRLGMQYIKNFIHPALDVKHPLAEHLLYSIQNPNVLEQ